MRVCATCGADCDSQIGLSRELKTVYWGGKRHGSVEYSPKLVAFFCGEECRAEYIAIGSTAGEIQTNRGIEL